MRAHSKTLTRARRLRREMTLPEMLLWQALREHPERYPRFRRQHAVGPYVLDFYCPSARLALEIDGAAHNLPPPAVHDAARDAWLASQGIRVLRIPAVDVLDQRRRPDVVATITAAASAADS